MSRHKLPDDKKKPKIGISLNKELLEYLNEHLTDIKINRSKYIENLIKEDMIKRGKDIKSDFEK
jgi:metal-responsive CopG/Arc/MetJ family transcriptional regulator